MGQIINVLKIILHKIIGIAIFFLILFLANILKYIINNETFSSLVGFVNNNIWVIMLFTVIFFFGELFNALVFPLNLPAPIFNSVGNVLIIYFLIDMFELIDRLGNLNIVDKIKDFYTLIIVLVFVLTLILGYINIILSAKKDRDKIRGKEEKRAEKKKRKK